MLTPSQIASEISNPEAVAEQVSFDIDSAIRLDDLTAIWQPAIVTRMAAVDDVTRGGLLAKIRQKWGGAADLPNYRKAIRREQGRLRLRDATKNGSILPPIQTNGRPLRDMAEDSIAALRACNDPAT